MASKKLNLYLHAIGRNSEYTALLNHALQLNKIKHMLAESAAIPEHLIKHCELGPLSGNQLTLLAANASVAARLKHMVPSILQKIQKKGWQISSIKVRIQKPALDKCAESISKQKMRSLKPKISGTGLKSLNRLALSLPDSELKTSIQRLLKKTGFN
ncbi:Protein of unknown function [Nitrosomonas marina]|uniref:DUF721 domain-containing protein n=1 Tax=Nitrosomonas marina TaxID=917 RepID=A0A1I0AA92_9PROT|nr:DciA family protein [Nitrosomonas marina]SES90646.1 Protein of unknown function [Nitrosomonas marina]